MVQELPDRSQSGQVVKIEYTTSKALPLEFRVPQGSIPGPLLFTVYVNDLPLVPRYYQSAIYVDDDKLFLAFQSCKILKAGPAEPVRANIFFQPGSLRIQFCAPSKTLLHAK